DPGAQRGPYAVVVDMERQDPFGWDEPAGGRISDYRSGAELATVGQCIGLGLSSAALADEDVRADAGYGFAWQMRQVVERILSQLALRCYYLLFVAAIGAAQRSSAWGKLHPGTTRGARVGTVCWRSVAAEISHDVPALMPAEEQEAAAEAEAGCFPGGAPVPAPGRLVSTAPFLVSTPAWSRSTCRRSPGPLA